MKRIACALLIAFASVALADDVDRAKQLFEEANTLYKAGKLVPAIEKLQESYKLSKNVFLLYNIGRAYDQLGQKELVLYYYKKFLAGAPANAPMRPDVTKRVDELVKEGVPEANPETPTTPPPVTPDKPAVEIKHVPVEATQPGKAIDIVATPPAGVTVTLNFRGAADTTFVSVPMTARDADVVGQIPADKVHGNYVQYYLEARDASGAVVARAGKSTSPNLIDIEGGSGTNAGLEFDPLSEKRRVYGEKPPEPPTPYWKETWITTGVTGVMLGTTVVMYMLASKYSDELHDDSTSCGTPPCTPFDKDYDARLETLGKRYNVLYKVSLGLTVASAGVAGYFWYKRTKAKPKLVDTVTLTIDDNFAGIATVGRF